MNARKQFAEDLRRLSVDELADLRQRTTEQFEQAKSDGSCSLEAVLYFDLAQIDDERNRRNPDYSFSC